MDKIAIIIPTKNRSNFVNPLLKYYSSFTEPITVYVSDSSDNFHKNKICQEVKKYNFVKYLHFPNSRSGLAIKKALDLVEEKYVLQSGDDDYFIPSSLNKILSELKENSSTSSVCGKSFLISSNFREPGINILEEYFLREIEGETSSIRFINLAKNYSPLIFALHRIEDFKLMYSYINESTHVEAEEYLPVIISSLLGEAKLIDELFLFRGVNFSRRTPVNLEDLMVDKIWVDNIDVFFSEILNDFKLEKTLANKNYFFKAESIYKTNQTQNFLLKRAKWLIFQIDLFNKKRKYGLNKKFRKEYNLVSKIYNESNNRN